MKLCQIMAGNEEGGLENHFVDLCNALSRTTDFEISVIAHQKYQHRFDVSIQFLALDLSQGRRNPFTLYKLQKLIKQTSADIIHAHANKAAAMLSSVQNLVPGKKIATVHSIKKNNKMFEKMDWVIGVSRDVLRNINNKNKSVIYNGVSETFLASPTQEVTRASLGIDNPFPIIISIGRLVAVKGLDVLLKACSNIPVNLLIVGDGELLEELKQTAQINADVAEVYFLGQRNDIKNLLTLADLTIISSYREGFSYVVAESLLTHTPVISTDVPVANEILPIDYIVPVGDSEKLHNAIEKFINNQDAAEKDFERIYDYVKIEFTLANMVNKLIENYRLLLA
jgi:glycosyltransferase involved in cell wall biosynthesis